MLVLNLPFKALMFLTLMRPSLVLFLVLWLKLVKDFLKVRCRLALLPFLISCLIWLDLVASLPRSEERFSRNAETDLVCRLLLEKKKWRRPPPCRTTQTGLLKRTTTCGPGLARKREPAPGQATLAP